MKIKNSTSAYDYNLSMLNKTYRLTKPVYSKYIRLKTSMFLFTLMAKVIEITRTYEHY